jgi:hypothetical protein
MLSNNSPALPRAVRDLPRGRDEFEKFNLRVRQERGRRQQPDVRDVPQEQRWVGRAHRAIPNREHLGGRCLLEAVHPQVHLGRVGGQHDQDRGDSVDEEALDSMDDEEARDELIPPLLRF